MVYDKELDCLTMNIIVLLMELKEMEDRFKNECSFFIEPKRKKNEDFEKFASRYNHWEMTKRRPNTEDLWYRFEVIKIVYRAVSNMADSKNLRKIVTHCESKIDDMDKNYEFLSLWGYEKKLYRAKHGRLNEYIIEQTFLDWKLLCEWVYPNYVS